MTTTVNFVPSMPLLVEMSNYCCKAAQRNARKMLKTAVGVAGMHPIARPDGTFGVYIEPKFKYMLFQNDGIRPFIMWQLSGKCIPMRIGGRLIFRYANNVGETRINKRDPKTGRIMTGNSPIAWRHPGLAPKHFIENAVDETLAKFNPSLGKEMMAQITAMGNLNKVGA